MNPGPSAYETDELTTCSTLLYIISHCLQKNHALYRVLGISNYDVFPLSLYRVVVYDIAQITGTIPTQPLQLFSHLTSTYDDSLY